MASHSTGAPALTSGCQPEAMGRELLKIVTLSKNSEYRQVNHRTRASTFRVQIQTKYAKLAARQLSSEAGNGHASLPRLLLLSSYFRPPLLDGSGGAVVASTWPWPAAFAISSNA